MKFYILFAFAFLTTISTCTQSSTNNSSLKARVDSLEANSYKPGFGEFMSGIQSHHAKLWFAGQNQNWKLAEFEIAEIKENLAAIKKYCSDRTETNSIGMIEPAIDSVDDAIANKNTRKFNESYSLLTNSCNNCHQATKHEFNIIKIPDNQPFINQDFKVHQPLK